MGGHGETFGFVASSLVLVHPPMGREPRPKVFWMACAPLDGIMQGVATSMFGVAVGCMPQVFRSESLGVTELGTQPCFLKMGRACAPPLACSKYPSLTRLAIRMGGEREPSSAERVVVRYLLCNYLPPTADWARLWGDWRCLVHASWWVGGQPLKALYLSQEWVD